MRFLPALLFLALPAFGAAPELRGAWMARDSFTSRASIARAMEELAANNFNVVLVNAWSRGYPLWRSEVFRGHTSFSGDPGYPDRDVLAECIEEGHRVGLEVVAWMEYGFVGGFSGYFPGRGGKGPIFDAHPDWPARTAAGSDAFPISGGAFYWMAHTRPDAQQFLLDLFTELADNYDLDGIEFDRFRYPQLDCGYDAYTVQLYRDEHNGQAPPAAANDAEWMRWRADKLNDFVLRAYGAVKGRRAAVQVSNAPTLYPGGYTSFLQDYPGWLRAGALDHVTPQVYRRTGAEYAAELVRQLAQVSQPEKVFPGLAVIIGSDLLPSAEVVEMVRATRSRSLRGMVFWYYGVMDPKLVGELKQNVFAEPAAVPGRAGSWKREVLYVQETDAEVGRTAGWRPSTGGWNGNQLLASGGGEEESITYNVRAPRSGYYEVYAYTAPAADRAAAAAYQLSDSTGTSSTVVIDQRAAFHAGWVRLGEALLQAGQQRAVVRLSTAGVPAGQTLAADALLLIRSNRRPFPAPAVTAAGIVNAATFAPGLAPGSIASLFGISLAEGEAAGATSLPLPFSLAGTAVTLRAAGREFPMPLYYVSATQINAQVPWAAPAGAAEVVISRGDLAGTGTALALQAAAPGLFAVAPSTVARGGVVSVYATGLGPVTPAVADGAAAPSLSSTTLAVSATVGEVSALILYSGLAPGFAALYQVNVRIPQEAPSGNVPLVIAVAGQRSSALTLVVE